MKNHCYLHSCNKNIQLQILKEMIDNLKIADLYSHLDSINICLVGLTNQSIINNLKNYDQKINICFYNPNPLLYQYPCLHSLWERCQNETNCNILYMHTNGENSLNYNVQHEWRNYMQYNLVYNYKICLERLYNYDTVGSELLITRGQYAGNFWWAKGSYIKQLKNPNIYLNDKKFYEIIGSSSLVPNKNYAELWLLKDFELHEPKVFNFLHIADSKSNKPKSSEDKDLEDQKLLYYNQLRKQNIISKKEYCQYSNQQGYVCNQEQPTNLNHDPKIKNEINSYILNNQQKEKDLNLELGKSTISNKVKFESSPNKISSKIKII